MFPSLGSDQLINSPTKRKKTWTWFPTYPPFKRKFTKWIKPSWFFNWLIHFKIHFVITYSYKHDESSRICYHLRWTTCHIFAFEICWMGDYLLNMNKVMIFQFQDIARFEMRKWRNGVFEWEVLLSDWSVTWQFGCHEFLVKGSCCVVMQDLPYWDLSAYWSLWEVICSWNIYWK